MSKSAIADFDCGERVEVRGADFPHAQTRGEAPSPAPTLPSPACGGGQGGGDLSPQAGRGEAARQQLNLTLMGTCPAVTRMNSLLPRMNSLFGRKNFAVFGGAGNRLQAIESAWRLAPKTARRGWNRAKFPKIPC